MAFGDSHRQVHRLLADLVFQVSPVHGAFVPAEIIFHPVIQNQGIKQGRQNQAVLAMVLKESAKGLLPQIPVRRIKEGEHLAPGQLFLLRSDLQMKDERSGEFVKEARKGGAAGQVFSIYNFLLFFLEGERMEPAMEFEGMAVVLQGRIIQKRLQARIRQAGQGEAKEEQQVFQLVPTLLPFLEQGFVLGVLGVFGKQEAAVKKGFEAFFQDRFVLFQRPKEFRRVQKRDFPSLVLGLKIPGGL